MRSMLLFEELLRQYNINLVYYLEYFLHYVRLSNNSFHHIQHRTNALHQTPT